MFRTLISAGSSRLRALAPVAFAVAALSASPAFAVTYTESGDAGQTQATGQLALGSTAASLTDIFGTISTTLDADLYVINITSPSAFSATTVNAGTTVIDTQLFLLTLAGAPVYFNDDDGGGLSLGSTLSAGSSFGPVTAGRYLLGISTSGYSPVNSNNQLLFAGGLNTSLRGPASGLQPAVLGGFSDDTFAADSGAYRIQLTGVSPVPESGTGALMLLGGGLLGLLAARRKHAGRAA